MSGHIVAIALLDEAGLILHHPVVVGGRVHLLASWWLELSVVKRALCKLLRPLGHGWVALLVLGDGWTHLRRTINRLIIKLFYIEFNLLIACLTMTLGSSIGPHPVVGLGRDEAAGTALSCRTAAKWKRAGNRQSEIGVPSQFGL